MRKFLNPQLILGEVDIPQIEFNEKSENVTTQILLGLQYIYMNSEIREAIFEILKTILKCDRSNGRPGMDLWSIFVLGSIRLNLNISYKFLKELTDYHSQIRLMLGLDNFNKKEYSLQSIKDNIKLFTPEILLKINAVVVKAGYNFKNKEGPIAGKCDSFVVETNVHFPTDTSLLYDATRKIIELISKMCEENDIKGYRQSKYKIRKLKSISRAIGRIKRSISKNEEKREQKERRIKNKYKEYIDLASKLISEANEYKEILKQDCKLIESDFILINEFVEHADRQIDQIKRRVLKEEVIPHEEKCFSIFQPHTEWICKGKKGVPVELGMRVAIVEDNLGFILHHVVMIKQTDDKVAVSIVEDVKNEFETFSTCSFDKGFYTKENREQLNNILGNVILTLVGIYLGYLITR